MDNKNVLRVFITVAVITISCFITIIIAGHRSYHKHVVTHATPETPDNSTDLVRSD